MDNKTIKENFISALFGRNIYTRAVNNIQYVTRCPYCGDSIKSMHTGHFYIKVDTESNYPIVYDCKRCPAQGIVTKEVLERLEIMDTSLLGEITYLNKSSDKYNKKDHVIRDDIMFFDFSISRIYPSNKIAYIENRLQHQFTEKELEDMKVVLSLREFLMYNKIHELQCPDSMAFVLERDYVGFLSLGNSYLLLRDITDTHEHAWIKYPLTKDSSKSRAFYAISSSIDIYTEELITVNLFEGVFCALSIAFNFGEHRENCINIVVGGKYYEAIILYLIKTGIVGENIEINIYADNDKEFNKKNRGNDTELPYYEKLFRNYKYLFKKITVIYNRKGKDYGVPKDEILLERHKL